MKKLYLFFFPLLVLSGQCFGQMEDFKSIDSMYTANYKQIQIEKISNYNLSQLIESKENFLLKSGRLILDKNPVTDFYILIPEQIKNIYNELDYTSYKDLEIVQYEIDNFYKEQILIAFLESRREAYIIILDLAKDRLVKCLHYEGVHITDFHNMSKAEKIPIQKRCFPEHHQ